MGPEQRRLQSCICRSTFTVPFPYSLSNADTDPCHSVLAAPPEPRRVGSSGREFECFVSAPSCGAGPWNTASELGKGLEESGSLPPSPYSRRPPRGRVWAPAVDGELRNPAGFVFHHSRLASPTGTWYSEQPLAGGTGADQQSKTDTKI